jgi:hypothetical protein
MKCAATSPGKDQQDSITGEAADGWPTGGRELTRT